MADHIPFITGEDACNLVARIYADSEVVRVPIERADRFTRILDASANVWLDPGVDGIDDIESRRSRDDRTNPWFELMRKFANFEKIGTTAFQARPVTIEVDAFVNAVLDAAAAHKPAWLTVPQLPLVINSDRNKINRELARATGKWKDARNFSGRLILPLIFKHQEQLNGKTARNSKVLQAEKCYHDANADGFWAVDSSLSEERASATLRRKRFAGIVALHEELNDRISSRIRIGGPYWGLNLVLWARGLVDYPAIGIGSGYRYLISGMQPQQANARLALPALRRRAGVGTPLRAWLDATLATLGPSHPAYADLAEIKKHYTLLSQPARSRRQVAEFYKQWFNTIAAAPKAGRSMAMFQDLSAAYALGKSLREELLDEQAARRPEAVAEPLMLSCL